MDILGLNFFSGSHSITMNVQGNTFMTTTVTSKGQVTIPKRVRDASGVKPGKSVNVEYVDGKVVISPVAAAGKSDFRKRLEKVRGTLDLGMSADEFMKMMRGDD